MTLRTIARGAAAWILSLMLCAGAARAQDAPPIERLQLDEARVSDAARLLAAQTGRNVVTTEEAGRRQVTLLLRDVDFRVAVETLCKLADLWYREEEGVVRIMTAAEFQRDLTVQREASVRVFTLLHPNPEAVGQAIRDLFGPRVELSYGVDDRFSGTRLGGGGVGAAGLGSGAAAGALSGSGAARFSDRFSGSGATARALPAALSQGGAAGAPEPETELRQEPLSAERLSRLREEDGKLVGDLRGVTRAPPRIRVTLNRRQKLVAVRTSDTAALEQIAALVAELDRPTPQVLLELKILEVRLGDDFHSVLDVDYVTGPGQPNLPTGKETNPFVAGAATVLEQVAGAGNFPLSGGTLIYQFLNEHVRARLQLLDRNDRLSVLSTPLLLCANDEVARVFVGEERPLVRNFELQTTSTNGVIQNTIVPTVDLRDIGTTLRIVPSINADRTVTLTILQDVSDVVPGGASLPVPTAGGGLATFSVDTVSTSNLQGTVIAKDGLTLAVGGLVRKAVVDRQEGIPYLMDLPLIGWLFGETVRSEEHRELLLLVTPHVLLTPEEGQRRSEARLRALSLHPYHDLGDRALRRYDRSSVPGAADYHLLVEDYLLGAPEPIR
ncbi:MAG: hypothetical protein D6731_04950 [Planctomycetota bacterium]|nr:MAG: hypothetical protein D6731_04950 [Planctomycetota bacterium]